MKSKEQVKDWGAKTPETGTGSTEPEASVAGVFKHRSSANGYLAFTLIGTFFTGLLLYLEFDMSAVVLFGFTWLVNPVLIITDHIVFDGSSIRRTGLLPILWSRISGKRVRLELHEIELVETQALRALRKGGDVIYRYRTLIAGKEVRLGVASGGAAYRRLVRALFAQLPEDILDTRSVELRDYLVDPKEVQTKARFAKIPSSDVLEPTLWKRSSGVSNSREDRSDMLPLESIEERRQFLRELANELRVAGNLVQALEVFRRALRLSPDDAWLLFEFARCLHSYAGAEKSAKFERRSLAALRLSEKRSENDEKLLSRIGETYFQFGEWRRAKLVFQKTMDFAGSSFRSVRGMAELSLREGKIAHVIHHFAAASRLAETPALKRWTNAEVSYFARLNSDDEYMDMELNRVGLLDSFERYKRTSLRVVVMGLPLILVGMVMDSEPLAQIGWTVCCVALLIWTGMHVSRNLMSSRIPQSTK